MPLVTASGVEVKACLHFTTDRYTNTCYIIDTGVAVSVVPAQLNDHKSGEKGSPLHVANGTRIAAYGTKMLPLDLGLHCRFRMPVTIAVVSKPFLGA